MTSGSMTKAELVEEVSRVSDLTKKHSEVIVDTVFKSIIDALHRGEKIELRGFGSFRLRKREPRKGRNPKTGDKVDVPPKKVPYFKPGKELKELIDKEPRPGSGDIGASRRVRGVVERLWSPWRLSYVTRGDGTATEDGGCVFCEPQGPQRRPRASTAAGSPSSFSTSIPTTTATSWWCRTGTWPIWPVPRGGARRVDRARPPRRVGPHRGLCARRHQRRDQPRPHRRRRRARAPAHSSRPPVERRHELHGRHRRNARAAGRIWRTARRGCAPSSNASQKATPSHRGTESTESRERNFFSGIPVPPWQCT